ncbi:hypothetical protein [Morganella psychrotolerans]|uniref:Uncharacterized protein n=1 Tax=Morganella psychrotolerans TaxID=368603 RepID=A0A1B8H806_9GAMM|nr:hypothetical protein [Morganella psychrotolerans]OBU02108.1 hypothetical protein AYY17_13970 [Morganella psychrotolerans]OBU05208.1 hypothetical protein AYY18_09035 [Morganella psychrotolerans]
MKKIGLPLLCIPLLLFGLFLFFHETGRIIYHESDTYRYYLYTDSGIRNAPRITDNYQFEYIPTEGSISEMSSIVFRDAGDSAPLKNYLSNAGYYLYRIQDQGQDEIWLSAQNNKALYSLRWDKQSGLIRLSSGSL